MHETGVRLRLIRKRLGLSQRELARRAGVTNATISMIERNRISPSVASLKKVLDSLGMSLGQFFADEPHDHLQPFFSRTDLVELGDPPLSLRQVGRDLSGRSLQMLHETYGPDADTGADMLSHDGEEAGIVVRGQVEVTVAGMTHVLGPGDAYHFSSRLPHRFCHVGDDTAEIISACTPPSF